MYSKDIIGVPTHIVHILIFVLYVLKEQGVLAFKETPAQIEFFSIISRRTQSPN